LKAEKKRKCRNQRNC